MRRSLAAWGFALPLAAMALSAPARAGEILLRLRAEGPHAIEGCAQTRHARGQALAPVARDGSDSLDRLNARHGLRSVRALFRRPDGTPFARQRAAQARRALSLRGDRRDLPPLPDLSHVYRLRVASGESAAAIAARYARDPHVVWAQPNGEAVLDLVPNDPFFASSGAWGQDYLDQFGLHAIRAPEAWDLSLGDGVVVAVVDSGSDLEHPDLADNLWLNPGEDLDGDGSISANERNGIDDDGNGFVDDFHGFDFANSLDANEDGDYDDPGDVSDADPFDDRGHGTHVAGIVSAVTDNGIGLAGVAPRARLMSLKGFAAIGSASFADLTRAMVYAVRNGARVINNSWSCSLRCPSNPVVEEAVAFANALGVVVVTSAGNRSDDVRFFSPENGRGVVTVGATQQRDDPTIFTNQGLLLDVMAPGGSFRLGDPRVGDFGILSLLSSGAPPGFSGGGFLVVGERYLRLSGTSMAAPHVAGVAALLLSQRPELTPQEVRGILRASARDRDLPGHDARTGAGLVDARGALERDPPSVAAFFDAPLHDTVLRAPDPVPIRGALAGDVVRAELAFGLGSDPASFVSLARIDRPLEGLLATWDVAGLAEGPYVLRLEVEGASGDRVVEHRLLSLERNRPRRISSEGPAARAPAVAGRTVVWQSERPLEPEDDRGLDLFAFDWSSGEQWRIVSGPDDDVTPVLASKRLAWRTSESREIRSCRVSDRRGPCRGELVARGDRPLFLKDASSAGLTWSVGGNADGVRACRWQGRACSEVWVPVPSGLQPGATAALSGSRLFWPTRDAGRVVLLSCDLAAGTCVPSEVPVVGPWPPLRLVASRQLLAWRAPVNGGPIFGCAAGGDCDASLIAPESRLLAGKTAVSGLRVAWHGPGAGGDDDVFFCERDPQSGACPIQQVTATPAHQRNVAISGNRLVWEDDGAGPVAIFGLELPSLSPIADRRVVVGERLRIRLRGRDPAGEGGVLAAVFADGTPLEARGAELRDRGDGQGSLRWRPGPEALGRHRLLFSLTSAGGLVARRAATVEVVDADGG